MIDSIIECLRNRAATQPDKCAFTFLGDGEASAVSVTYLALHEQALSIAGTILEAVRPGERALLPCAPGLQFISALFGCLYAGVIAVPVRPPDPNRGDGTLATFREIASDCSATVIVSETMRPNYKSGLLQKAPELRKLKILELGSLDLHPGATLAEQNIPESSIAFLQYTSGSTSDPKGVIVTHSNLIANQKVMSVATGHLTTFEGVGWLPLYHDMGLVGFIFHPLYRGIHCTLMSPLHFVQKPLRWLKAISNSDTVVSAGPNFAYELCARRISDAQKRQLNLSGWKIALTGAEPIRAETLRRFSEAFSGCGFDSRAFYPCYGLAESTLMVSGGIAGTSWKTMEDVNPRPLSGSNRTEFVSCGAPSAGHTIAIVDPETERECADGSPGEIWVSGPSVAAGYWNKTTETERTFRAYMKDCREGPFLRTGDLGFISGRELYVTGRLKDVIIQAGRTIYPHDVEATIEASNPTIFPNGAALVGLPINGIERLIAMVEVRSQGLLSDRIIADIRSNVANVHGLRLSAVMVIRAGGIPRTSSGKIKRFVCRRAFVDGKINSVASWHGPEFGRPKSETAESGDAIR